MTWEIFEMGKCSWRSLSAMKARRLRASLLSGTLRAVMNGIHLWTRCKIHFQYSFIFNIHSFSIFIHFLFLKYLNAILHHLEQLGSDIPCKQDPKTVEGETKIVVCLDSLKHKNKKIYISRLFFRTAMRTVLISLGSFLLARALTLTRTNSTTKNSIV